MRNTLHSNLDDQQNVRREKKPLSGAASVSGRRFHPVVGIADDSVIELNELVVPPLKFNGRRPTPRKLLEDFERTTGANSWSEAVKSKCMPTYLRVSVYDWFLTFPRRMFGEGYIP